MQKTLALRGWLLTILISFFFQFSFAQTFDDTFKPKVYGPARVAAISVQADGKVIVGGTFIAAGSQQKSGMARFNADGTLDASFSAEVTGGEVRSITIQADGKLIVCGYFTTVNGVTIKNGIVRLLSDGSLDTSFDASSAFVYTPNNALVLSDGKILVGGPSVRRDEEFRGIVRLNANGSFDETFTVKVSNQSGSSNFYGRSSFALQADGKILFGSEFTHVNGTTSGGIIRLNIDGSLDNTFQPGTGANGAVNDIIVLPDGKIIIVGTFKDYQSATCNGMARLNADGTIDNTFASPFAISSWLMAVNRQVDGKLIVTGSFNTPAKRICRLSADGAYDNTFVAGTSFNSSSYAMKTLGDGTLLVGGEFTSYKGTTYLSLINLNSTGTVVPARDFFIGGKATIYATLVYPDGGILIGGNFLLVNGVAKRYFARLTSNGLVDGSFNPGTGPDDIVKALGLQADGKILVGGQFTYYNGVNCYGLVRIDASGARDNTFLGNGLDSRFGDDGADAFIQEADGKIIIAGGFKGKDGTVRYNLVRLNTNGTLDNTFNAANSVPSEGELMAITKLSDGRVVAGGPSINSGYFYGAFANGVLDPTYFKVPEPATYSLQTWNDKIVMGGVSGISLLNNDGSRDPNFVPQENKYQVLATAIVNNKIITGPSESYYSSNTTPVMQCYNADGTLDPNMSKVVEGGVRRLSVDGNGNLLVAGTFSRIDGQSAFSIARFIIHSAPASAPGTLSGSSSSPTEIQLTWTDNSAGQAGFEIQRSTGTNTNFVSIKTLPQNTTTFTDKDVNGATTYYYRVRAVNLKGSSAFSNEFSITTSTNALTPATPLTLEALSHVKVKLTWQNVPGTETAYELYRSKIQDGNYQLISTRAKDQSTYEDASVTPSTTYYYKVRVVFTANYSDFTAPATITTAASPLNPATNFTATAQGFSQIRLTWTDNSTGETSYSVFRKKDSFKNDLTTYGGNSEFSLYKTLPANSVEFLDSDLLPGRSYNYYVTSNLGNEASAPTTVRSVTTSSYSAGSWVQKNNFEGAARRGAVSFVIGDKAYIATGVDATTRYKDLWEYNSQLDDWTQKTDFPGTARYGAIGFSINGKGYVGLGNSVNGGPFDRDLYEYDPTNNTWTKKADFPADPVNDGGRTSSSVFVLNGLAYVVFGNNGTNNPKTVYAYDPVANTWTQKADYPGNGRLGGFAFTIGTKGYAGYGTSLNKYDDLYEYNPTNNTWTAVNPFSAKPSGRTSMTVVSPGIMITGDVGDFTQSNTKEIFQFLPDIGNWIKWSDFSGVKRGNGVGFRIGNRLFFGTGSDANTYLQDMWSFTSSALPAPSAPADLKATYASLTSLNITWRVAGETQTSLVLERSTTEGSGYAPIATLAPDAIKFTDTGLTSKTMYYYRIKAVNAEGSSAYTSASGYTAPTPAAPANFAHENISATETKLTWTEDGDVASSFNIYRSIYSNTGFTKIHSTATRVLSYNDNTVTSDAVFFYYVEAVNVTGTSPASLTREVLTLPETPVISKRATSSNNVTINIAGTYRTFITKLEVHISTDDVNYTVNSTQYANGNKTISVVNLLPDTKYYFKMKSMNDAGTSAFSNTINITTTSATPSNVQAIGESNSSVKITWTKGSNALLKYRAYIKDNVANAYKDSVTTDADASSAVIGGLIQDKEYWVGVASINDAGISQVSGLKSVYTLPDAPVIAKKSATSSTAAITWTGDYRIGSTQIEMYRSTDDVNYTLQGTSTTAASKTISVSGLTPDTKYYFKAKSKNFSGTSPFSNTISITAAPSTAPAGLAGTGESTTSIKLTWTKVANPETAYRIYYKDNLFNNFKDSVTTSADVSSVVIDGLLVDKDYYVAVAAVNSSGVSAKSETKTVLTLSNPPANLSVTGGIFGNQLQWEDPSETEDKFIIERSENTEDNFQQVAEVSANVIGHLDNRIKPGRTYFYRVKVVNKGGTSAASNVASVTSDLFVGVETSAISGLSVFPVPVRQKLNVSFADANHGQMNITITDLQGSVIYSNELSSSEKELEIEMSSLAAGVYVLHIQSAGKKDVRLIAKE